MVHITGKGIKIKRNYTVISFDILYYVAIQYIKRNGPGKFEVGQNSVCSPFDADGMITAITLQDGRAVFRNKFVITNGFKQDKKAKQFMYRGAFGTKPTPGFLGGILQPSSPIKIVSNINAIYWDKKVLALGEGGLPYRLAGDSLQTLGEGPYTCRGILRKGQTFSVHPKVDIDSDTLITFATSPEVEGAKNSDVYEISVFEFDENLGLKNSRNFEVKKGVYFHDFTVTENFYIFHQSPLNRKFGTTVYKWQDSTIDKFSKKSLIYLVPRNKDSAMQVIENDVFHVGHHVNAYEKVRHHLINILPFD